MWAFILAPLLGILAGTITGLTPGIHINLISAMLINYQLTYGKFISPISSAVFIVSMSITHTFLNFIPSILLGTPEEDSFLSILPGHKLMREGKGYEAIIYTLYGSIFALPIILILTPPFLFFLPLIYEIIKNAIPYILIFISIYFIFRERNIISSLIIFSLSGVLGFLSFNLPVNEPLLPLLSGLFGTSSMLISIKSTQILPKQEIIPLRKIRITKKEFLLSFISSAIFSPIGCFLPGIGSGHASVIASEIIPQTRKGFLLLVGSVNTVVMGLSFITLYSINKSRTGSALAIQKILPNLNIIDIFIILISIFITSIICFFLTIYISKNSMRLLNKINYRFLTILICIFILLISYIFSGIYGIIILLSATSIGTYCIISNSKRINLMGALILPTILFYIMV